MDSKTSQVLDVIYLPLIEMYVYISRVLFIMIHISSNCTYVVLAHDMDKVFTVFHMVIYRKYLG